jgi:Zn finger protein HypA/HybF involved in hydrogenase expression
MEYRILNKKEQELISLNIATLQIFFRYCTKKCSNCEYPLSGLAENYFSTEAEGPVCELCHALEFTIRRHRGLTAAHDEWKREQTDKKRILEKGGNKYFPG